MRKASVARVGVYASEVRAHVMLIFMDKIVNTKCVLVNVANMEHAIWKHTAVPVMKGGQVIDISIQFRHFASEDRVEIVIVFI